MTLPILETIGFLWTVFALVKILCLVLNRPRNRFRSHIVTVSANRAHLPQVNYWEDCGLSLKNEKVNIVGVAHPMFLSTEAELICIRWAWSQLAFSRKA